MIGRVISGRYVVEAVVGTGGMAVVYRAYDKIKKQTVAIKVLRPEYEQDEEFVRRFSREAEAASKVSHENIVNMQDVGVDGDLRYIVMEYVDGQTLKDMIREKGRIEPDQALRMTIRILAAVDHAHRNGIVHRDIKPQNILVDRQGRVKVADFGIARLKASQTTILDNDNGASALGSVHYFSPEQARGEVADEKSDLYSVGVVLYEMLTGRVPFDGETSVSVALKHVQEEPKSMRLFQSGISKALDEVVMRALCKDPSKRYQTAAEMAADLRKTITHPRGGFVKYPLDESEIEAQKETKKKKVQRRRHKAARAGRTAAVVVMVCIFAVGILYGLSIQGKVIVPSVVGEEQSAAQELLTAAGLTVTIGTTYSEEYDAGIVIEQSYNSGQRVDEGTSVTLTVSEGTQWFYMANFVGESEEDAMEALSDSGAKNITFDYVQDSEVEPGIVISQTPDAGYQSKDDAVVITVSGRSVLVPALTGLTLDGATALIEAEGLTVGTVTEGYSADAAANTVIAQNVAPNSEVLAGSEIDLTICRQEDSLYYPASSFTVVVPLENLKVEVTLETPSGEETVVYSQTMDMGTYPIELSSGESGTHTVRVYLEGVLIESTEIEFS